MFAALWSLVRSRIGRAWMALREDPLAAELMSIPVNRLKLLAFVFGAGIAGLTGAIVAPALTGVARELRHVDPDHDLRDGDPRRRRSLTGVVIGAIVINVSYELLTPATPDRARWLFYGVLIVAARCEDPAVAEAGHAHRRHGRRSASRPRDRRRELGTATSGGRTRAASSPARSTPGS